MVFTKEDLKVIEQIRNLRNEFEHYEVSGEKYSLWSQIVSFLEVIDKFLVEHLKIQLEHSADSFELHEKISKIESVWERIRREREKDLQDELLQKKGCFEEQRKQVLADIERDYYVNKGDLDVFIVCSECGDETLIIYDEFEGICSNPECLHTAPITECARCGQSMEGFPWEVVFCDYCKGKMADY